MTLVFRQEYTKVEGIGEVPKVLLPQEWLLAVLDAEPSASCEPPSAPQDTAPSPPYRLLAHCTEKTSEPNSNAQWVKVFERFGLKLQVQATGCCGMAGTYGHEARNAGTSRVIYSQSWQAQVERPAAEAGEALATGYSCRSQVKRLAHQTLRHPLQVLLERVRAQQDE